MPTDGTPRRSIRVPNQLWQAAQTTAARRGEDLSTVIRAALEQYVQREDKK